MRLRPLHDCVIVKRDENEFVDENPEINRILKEGRIVLPEKYEGFFKKSAQRGFVVSVGSTCKYDYKQGERVIFGRFAGAKVKFGKEEYLMLKEYDILAKEEEGD